jgi:hypothetical protein
LIQAQSISDLNPGHTCVKVADAPSSVRAGDNATFQIIYRADWDAPHNQTFYACADITYVAAANFNTHIPCFNDTVPGEDDRAKATSTPTSLASNSDGRSGLSGGAIAGIVIGVVAGVAIVVVGALFLYRRNQRKQRNERLARMEDNARREQWAVGKNSSSQNSVQLNNLN